MKHCNNFHHEDSIQASYFIKNVLEMILFLYHALFMYFILFVCLFLMGVEYFLPA